MNPLKKLRQAMLAIFPWPARAERRQAITDARRGRIAAERGAAQAKAVQARLQQHAAANHIAEAIAAQIRRSK